MSKSPTPDPLRGLSTSPSMSSPTGIPERLLSKRTMEIQAEEGILPYRSPTHTSSVNSLLGSYNGSLLDEGSRSKTPESKLGLSLLDSLSGSSGLSSSSFPTTRRARADTMPSSLSRYPFRSVSPGTSSEASPIGSNYPTSGTTTPTRMSSGNTARSRGNSLSIPSSAFSSTFGSSVFSPWQVNPDDGNDKSEYTESNDDSVNPVIQTLDYLGLDDSSNHSSRPLNDSLGGTRYDSPPEAKSVTNLRASLGRLRSHSMSSTANYGDEMMTPLPPALQHLRNTPSRTRAISVGFLEAPQSFFTPIDNSSSSEVSVGGKYSNENMMLNDNGSMQSMGLSGSENVC
ncbi:hypothetical protein K493DRAFT_68794 [Basidiobolus meristosporus CBS 931.73]|uniref:Uncharacterized protein n=1 Tax=Basidiobolus meristosporus CBS 931.73 TaxID=1314790 RepID=A0A1Y1Z070_9FUNG|nr:hypothetical protein K493DRAFT_68794 [Basidiobolus meristosporus CBS 931.73]|eukprot:ORY03514.1 hypothetical protein K493DRAFT_68794 [Basidiobolus meristosporus CBS 931.73]